MKRGKFCPKCGTQVNIGDAYCTNCGYSFRGRRGKKLNLKSVIILIIILIVAGIILQVVFNQSIIPQELIDIFKNATANQTG